MKNRPTKNVFVRGQILSRIKAMGDRQFTRLDVGLANPAYLNNLVKKGRLRVIKPGKPGRLNHRPAIFQNI